MILSKKQKIIFNWWVKGSPYQSQKSIIADGSIRAGKTFAFRQSFIIWAMLNFNNQNFGICGKTIGSVKRNILTDLMQEIKNFNMGYNIDYKDSTHCLTISSAIRKNRFYLFAGNDERSQDLIQGITLAGVYLDEVALMPESFVNQATARCSVEGSRLWFNCNPDNPYHFFKQEWIDKAKEKNILYLHLDMNDNPSLSEEMKQSYRSMYSGVFYQRYIQGLWTLAEGVVYDMWDEKKHTYPETERPFDKRKCDHYIAIDYGTINPCRFLDIYDDGIDIWVDDEYNWDSKKTQKQKTDREYLKDLMSFGDNPMNSIIIIDPSAASFKAEIRQEGFYLKDANNEVINGIRVVSNLLNQGHIHINQRCKAIIEEFAQYRWDEVRANKGVETVIKENDHSLDALRYMIMTALPSWRTGVNKVEGEGKE